MDARLVAARLPGLAMYGSPYASPSFPGYLPYGPAAAAVAAAADHSALYPHMNPGETSEAWRAGLTQAAAAAYYDPAVAAHYGYGYGPMGLTDGARRKNATRETTSTLKAWLNEHRKNPYPTKGEKIMLAIITKMTLTQVSTWFANARRRLKKENKMTWSPRNRCGEDDDEDDLDDGNHSNANNISRSSTPLMGNDGEQAQPQAGILTTGEAERRKAANVPTSGHSSGGESLSDESTVFSDQRMNSIRPQGTKRTEDANVENGEFRSDCSKEKESSNLGFPRPSSNDGTRHPHLPSHFTRHAIHPYANQRSSPSVLSTNITPTAGNSGGPRTGVPCHLPPSQGPHRMFHPGPGLPGQFNPAAAASLLAASRGHSLPPHVIMALNEQAQMHQQYQQALQNLPLHSMLAAQQSDGQNSSGNESPTSNASHSISKSPTTPSTVASNVPTPSPNKPKIWSLADVATSNTPSKSHRDTQNSPSSQSTSMHSPDLPVGDARTMHHWMDSVLHQRLSGIQAGKNPSALSNAIQMTPQQLQQFAVSLGSSSQHPANGFHPQFMNGTVRTGQHSAIPGLVDLKVAHEQASAQLREINRAQLSKRNIEQREQSDDTESIHSIESRENSESEKAPHHRINASIILQ